MKILIKNTRIINEGLSFTGSLLIIDKYIAKIFKGETPENEGYDKIIDGTGLMLIPGIIDDQVHFREPGATHKGDIASESAAAAVGGVTSFMDMPNNNPPICSIEALENKYKTASEHSFCNYSFYLGANNENIEEVKKVNPKNVCGIKVFMGSSTGNMLVDNNDTLEKIFKESPTLIATHCEEEEIIKSNLEKYKAKYGENIPFEEHPNIRNAEACLKSSTKAIELAKRNNSRLHILHISTKEEIDLLKSIRKEYPKISGELCVHYLRLCSKLYPTMGTKMKCNPAIKDEKDMLALRQAIKDGTISALATDHAPHLFSEKDNNYLKAPSGLPLVQHSLQVMLKLVSEGIFTIEEVVNAMCHAPAECFNIEKRGYIREGYFADLALVRYEKGKNIQTISKDNIAYKCGWSPFEGESFDSKIEYTIINGEIIVNKGNFIPKRAGERLTFNR